MARGFFVTGTDTGVGKTWISAALLHGFNRQGLRTVAMKPVASGCASTPAGLRNEDALLLQQTASVDIVYGDVNPYAFGPPIAPHLAARQSGAEIDPRNIKATFDRVTARGDVIIVEGVGGWQVPVNDTQTMADVAGMLGLPVVMVVGLRLGCLNHALLTEAAIRGTGLPLVGWVANGIDADMAQPEDNIESLKARITAPLLGYIPFLQEPLVEKFSRQISLP